MLSNSQILEIFTSFILKCFLILLTVAVVSKPELLTTQYNQKSDFKAYI